MIDLRKSIYIFINSNYSIIWLVFTTFLIINFGIIDSCWEESQCLFYCIILLLLDYTCESNKPYKKWYVILYAHHPMCVAFLNIILSVNAEFTQSPMYHKNATTSWPWSANALGPLFSTKKWYTSWLV